MIFTNEMLEEFMRCMNDIEYFAETQIKMNHPKDGLVPLVLNEFQRKSIQEYKEKNVFAKVGTRREGKTTVAAVILLHQAMFSEYKLSVVMAPNLRLSNQILDLIFEMYQNLPDYFKQNLSVTARNKTKLEFSNMSSIHSVGSNSMSLRGRTISNLYIDESESVSSLNEILEVIIPCLSAVSKSRLFAFTSTRTSDLFRAYA